jgi:uncharacterized protein YecE (DUF72 family)
MSHDPGVAESGQRADALASSLVAGLSLGSNQVRIGTASWTDPTLLVPGVFYPAGVSTPQARLKYYASKFSLVEVDSSYYALPARRTAELWLERTPAAFVFNAKAFAWMTGHATETQRLPRTLREALPADVAMRARLYPRDVPPEVRDEAWRLFVDALRPLHDAGKLGTVLLQYPPWVRPAAHSARMFARARERLADFPIAVEFRHGDWLAPAQRESTLSMLREQEMTYVIVDQPQGLPTSVPPEMAVTSSRLAVLRMHGRRMDTWEKPGATVLEKFRYLYDESELQGWVPKVIELAGEAEQVHVVFNNCYGNYGTTNALEMANLMAGYGRDDRRAGIE